MKKCRKLDNINLLKAGVAQWQSNAFVKRRRRFDSSHRLHMIPEKLIKEARKFAFEQARLFNAPPARLIEIAVQKGKEISEKLKADAGLVELGILLMDSQLGVALKEGKVNEHVSMGEIKTREILEKYSIGDIMKENILTCIREHHGVAKFSTIESEICCNADCYKFCSIGGFVASIRYIRDMEFTELMSYLEFKADEKWNALSLDFCKDELREQFNLIKRVLKDCK